MSGGILIPVVLHLGDIIFTHVLFVYQGDNDDLGRPGLYSFYAVAEEPGEDEDEEDEGTEYDGANLELAALVVG